MAVFLVWLFEICSLFWEGGILDDLLGRLETSKLKHIINYINKET